MSFFICLIYFIFKMNMIFKFILIMEILLIMVWFNFFMMMSLINPLYCYVLIFFMAIESVFIFLIFIYLVLFNGKNYSNTMKMFFY